MSMFELFSEELWEKWEDAYVLFEDEEKRWGGIECIILKGFVLSHKLLHHYCGGMPYSYTSTLVTDVSAMTSGIQRDRT